MKMHQLDTHAMIIDESYKKFEFSISNAWVFTIPFVTAPYHERDEIRNCAFNILYRRTSCDFIGEDFYMNAILRRGRRRGIELDI